MSSIQETIIWCGNCGLLDITKPVTNYGGDCCLWKFKRAYGKECKYWIRMSEEQEKIYLEFLNKKRIWF